MDSFGAAGYLILFLRYRHIADSGLIKWTATRCCICRHDTPHNRSTQWQCIWMRCTAKPKFNTISRDKWSRSDEKRRKMRHKSRQVTWFLRLAISVSRSASHSELAGEHYASCDTRHGRRQKKNDNANEWKCEAWMRQRKWREKNVQEAEEEKIGANVRWREKQTNENWKCCATFAATAATAAPRQCVCASLVAAVLGSPVVCSPKMCSRHLSHRTVGARRPHRMNYYLKSERKHM